MAYQALYRKYRPRTFGAVVGQDAVVRTLRNQLSTGRLSHAYLFCGTRGTGKTTVAKLLARALNCENLQEGEPCGVCGMCQGILAGTSLNVSEIDAASNTGVDNIRTLIEEVKYPPAQGKYRVYIIDEVHMLSTGAFNALLKTLEEPPAHVVFILATTDPQKVPPTILSRCQRFDFRRISVKEMTAALSRVAAEENIDAREDALAYLARLSEGSLRDGLSLLDQCASFYAGEPLTLEKARSLAGSGDDAFYDRLIRALAARDAAVCLEAAGESFAAGQDTGQLVSELIYRLRNLLVAQTIRDPEALLDLSAENIEAMRRDAGTVSQEELLYFISDLSRLAADLKYIRNPRIALEVELLRLCTGEAAGRDTEALAARLSALERDLAAGKPAPSSAQAVPAPPKPTPKAKPKPPAPKGDMAPVNAAWQALLLDLPKSTQAVLAAARPGFWEGDALVILCDNLGVEGIVKKRLPALRERLTGVLGREPVLRTMTQKDYEDRFAPAPAADTAKQVQSLLPDVEFEQS